MWTENPKTGCSSTKHRPLWFITNYIRFVCVTTNISRFIYTYTIEYINKFFVFLFCFCSNFYYNHTRLSIETKCRGKNNNNKYQIIPTFKIHHTCCTCVLCMMMNLSIGTITIIIISIMSNNNNFRFHPSHLYYTLELFYCLPVCVWLLSFNYFRIRDRLGIESL